MHDVVEHGPFQPRHGPDVMGAALGDKDEAGLAENQVIVLNLEIHGGEKVLVVRRVAPHEHVQLVGIVLDEPLGSEVGGDPFHAAEDAARHHASVQADGGAQGLLGGAGELGLGAAAAPGEIALVHDLALL